MKGHSKLFLSFKQRNNNQIYVHTHINVFKRLGKDQISSIKSSVEATVLVQTRVEDLNYKREVR